MCKRVPFCFYYGILLIFFCRRVHEESLEIVVVYAYITYH